MTTLLNTRAVAAKLSWRIIDKGQSLDSITKDYYSTHELGDQDRALVQELVYGICRWYGDLNQIASSLMDKPIRNKDRVIHFLLLVGLYQLRHLNIAEHAAVSETVKACKPLKKQWANNLINGCLRTYQRESKAYSLNEPEMARISHPDWMAKAISAAWPQQAHAIFSANNQRPPMCLRVNSLLNTRSEYLSLLQKADIQAQADSFSWDGIVLDKPVSVTTLPGFFEGLVSVQDTAAQLAAEILDAKPGQAVLDACAAPGGKTAHLLERADNQLIMHAVDVSEPRREQLHSTLDRLHLNADVYLADAAKTPTWPVAKCGYDRILIDAPCSGLGVIRRHPDIKHHRQPNDIDALNVVQQELLQQLWALVKMGGRLLYMTCSILPCENQQQIELFLKNNKNAQAKDFSHPHALDLTLGKQTLPGIHDMDGFYYCVLQKTQAPDDQS